MKTIKTEISNSERKFYIDTYLKSVRAGVIGLEKAIDISNNNKTFSDKDRRYFKNEINKIILAN